GHAMVRSPDEDAYPMRFKYIVDGISNLCRQFLLDLQALGERFNNAGELADADHAAIRHVSHPRPSQDRQHVMLAMTFKASPAQYDHLVIAFGLVKGLLQHCCRVLSVTDECFFECPRHPSRGLN